MVKNPNLCTLIALLCKNVDSKHSFVPTKVISSAQYEQDNHFYNRIFNLIGHVAVCGVFVRPM
jgi:hypothetical protein